MRAEGESNWAHRVLYVLLFRYNIQHMNNSKKGLVFPFFIGIIVILLVGGVVYLYENKKVETSEPVDNLNQQTKQTQQTNRQSTSGIAEKTTPVIKTAPTSISSPVKSSITVLYPNAGEVLNNGGRENIATIRWNSSGIGNSNVQIVLINKNDNKTRMIATNIPNTGIYVWKADPMIASGAYKIKISAVNEGLNISDESDYNFEIYKRSVVSGKTFVTLLSPNGGETFTAGDRVVIRWSSLGEKPTSATIRLSNNSRCPYGYSCLPLPGSYSTIAEISGNDLDKGEYEWVVNKSKVNSLDNKYLIDILLMKDDLSNTSSDGSDSSFIIN